MKSWPLELPAGVIGDDAGGSVLEGGGHGEGGGGAGGVDGDVGGGDGDAAAAGKATTMRVLAGSKLVPVRVTGVPPAVGPLLGVRLVVVGSGGGGGAT